MAMVKSELIRKIAEKHVGYPPKDVEFLVNQILEEFSKALANGDRIEIRGFGTICLHYRAPGRAHNPKTGKTVYTTGKHRPHFKPGKAMRERVHAGRSHPIKVEKKEEEEAAA